MALIRPFAAWRPAAELVQEVAAPPYDVMNSDEARLMAADKPYSFLHVDKAEIDLPPEIDLYDERVYLKARENLEAMKNSGTLRQDDKPRLYIYRQIREGRTQTGLVACVAAAEYESGLIKKHELTRADKEQDRVRHVESCAAQTGPIFLTYRKQEAIGSLMEAQTQKTALYDFDAADGVRHTVWLIDEEAVMQELILRFQAVEALYIADGHHRAASAVRVAQQERNKQAGNLMGEAEYEYFLAVLFPDEELNILPYNRVVEDLNGFSETDFLAAVKQKFSLEAVPDGQAALPKAVHQFGMYLSGRWYILKPRPEIMGETDPIASLDVSILQNHLLTPILGIGDPRIDRRIDFIGGVRGLKALEKRVGEDMQVAFALYPTQIEQLMEIADAGKIMPPKSTWFEPKLLSGIFIHDLF